MKGSKKHILNKKNIIALTSILLVILFYSVIYRDNVEIEDEDIPKSLAQINIVEYGAIADANFYNVIDGKYYVDASYNVMATDNSKAFQDAIDKSSIVYVPKGNYLIEGALSLSGEKLEIIGEDKLTTKLFFTGDKISKANTNAKNESIIINSGFDYKYDESKAQNINIKNISMDYIRDNNKKPNTLLLIGNINSAVFENYISNVYNSSNITDIGITNLDLYVACKNVNINSSKFINDTSGPSGGCIWVRNLTTKKTNTPDNKTQSIIITNNEFIKNSKDEIIAVFSSRGDVEDVTISDNEFTTFGTIAETNISIFSAKNGFYGKVKNVIIDNNKINIHDYNAFVVKVGTSSNTINPTSSVYIRNNKINVSSIKDSDRAKRIVYQADNISNNIFVENNNLEYVSSYNNKIIAISCKNGSIVNNTIDGNFTIGIENGIIQKNTISGCDVGISNPAVVEENIISNVNTGIKSIKGPVTLISKNTITLNTDLVNQNIGISIIKNFGDNSETKCADNSVYTHNNDIAYYIAKETVSFNNTNKNIGDGKYLQLSSNTTLLSLLNDLF